MISYVFKDGPVTIKNAAKADPQKVGAALAQIAEQQRGRLTPPAVIEAARNNRHPLHRFFEWDDAVAAESYRLDQARTLIRCVKIVSDDHAEPAPAFLSISDKGGTSYRTLQDVMDSADLQNHVLVAAERDLAAFEKRYRSLSDICDIIRDAREKIAARRANHESRAST
jgi:hypothetical protein